MKTHVLRARSFAVLVVALGALASCGGGDDARDPVLSLLERAASLHGEAEILASRGELDAAAARLDAVAALPFPDSAPERDDVRVDAHGEKARLLLAGKRAKDAEAAARKAIAIATRSSYFVGLAHLRLGDALRAQGRAREAVLAFERSIEVNRATMERLMSQPTTPAAPKTPETAL